MIGIGSRVWASYSWVLTVSLCAVLAALVGYMSATNPLYGLLLALGALVCMALIYMFFRNGRLSLDRVVVPLLLVGVLSPSIQLPGTIPSIRLELVIITVAWALSILGHLATGTPIPLRWNPANKWFILFGICILLSIAYAAVIHGYYPIGRDFWEFGKLVEYSLIFILVASLDVPAEAMRKYYVTAIVIFMCSAALGFAQYLNLWNINSWLSSYYAPSQIHGILTTGRIVGSTSNPNEFGALMALGASLALTGAIWIEERRVRLLSGVALGVFGVAVVLTLSRSALLLLLVAAIFILLFKYPLNFGLGRTIRMLVLVVPLLLVLALVLAQLAPDLLSVRVESALDLTTDASWQAKLLEWGKAVDVWRQSPLLGWGPGKDTMTVVVDNEWLLLLRRYGVVGVTVFILWFSGMYRTLSRIGEATQGTYTRVLCNGLQATLVIYAIFMIPAGIYHDLQLMPILVTFLGLAYTQRSTSRTDGQQ